ncbi:MAG: NADH-quinone oxidoreductase subunit J [Deltaproteobacteria bacterium]|jgi:NADH-quinone oxidoreductase subunit J|nr:NADH-quinone oxidoreductase subunit J [Deltaproteobacteria bacterium]MBW2182546.1 NADH-quinone oxidoreductase subunit J [Deltaproteobacteria bacterium]
MEAILFYVFAAVMVISSLMVVFRKNPVHSALFLVLTFFCLGGVYLLLNAQFIAAVQVIVYAGAIMVLFLFVIMLLNLEGEAASKGGHGLQKFSALILSVVLAVSLGSIMTERVLTGEKGAYSLEKVNAIGNSEVIGKLLFTDFLLPFEITSILLLAAIIGAIILAKKRL